MDSQRKVIVIVIAIAVLVALGVHFAQTGTGNHTGNTGKSKGVSNTTYGNTLLLNKTLSQRSKGRYDLSFNVPRDSHNVSIKDWNNGSRAVNATLTANGSGNPYYKFQLTAGSDSDTTVFPTKNQTYMDPGKWQLELSSSNTVNISLKVYASES